jgi:hypothetical protein
LRVASRRARGDQRNHDAENQGNGRAPYGYDPFAMK